MIVSVTATKPFNGVKLDNHLLFHIFPSYFYCYRYCNNIFFVCLLHICHDMRLSFRTFLRGLLKNVCIHRRAFAPMMCCDVIPFYKQ